jgi:hypothetical protein
MAADREAGGTEQSEVEPPSISHPNERRCADCGRIVSKHRGRWADREPRARQYQNAYHFTCRTHEAAQPDGGVRLEAADYHYVEGETQRHWSILDAKQ